METNHEPILSSSSYRVAFEDIEFLKRDDLRPIRLQLELLKPELAMEEHKIVSTLARLYRLLSQKSPDCPKLE